MILLDIDPSMNFTIRISRRGFRGYAIPPAVLGNQSPKAQKMMPAEQGIWGGKWKGFGNYLRTVSHPRFEWWKEIFRLLK